MNSIIKPFHRKFVLLFFDDILIYIKSLKEEVQHVDMVLKLLEEKKLYVNPSKCSFGFREWNILVILYLMRTSRWALTKLKL
jgi:hypothetical protein